VKRRKLESRTEGWVLIHSDAPSHPKFVLAGCAAFGAMITAASLASRFPSYKGTMPRNYLMFFCGPHETVAGKAIKALIEAGFLAEEPGDMLRLVGYPDKMADGLIRLQATRGEVRGELRERVLKRDRHRCKYCGSTEMLQIDHVIPVARGGRTHFENLQVLCQPCNGSKGAKLV
jgi:hypothetical protein